MTLFRRIITGTALAIMACGMASADIIVGYQALIGPTTTDITSLANSILPSWDPGSTNTMLSNVVGGGATTGISMASLNTPLTTYTLIGFNIAVKETLTGNYTLTNSSTNSAATGQAYIDSYTAVSLGSALAPPLTNASDPTNDLFNYSKTKVGTNPPSGPAGAQGEQPLSTGGGPDPNAPAATGLNIAANGGTFTSGSIGVNSGWVDYGCEVVNQVFCTNVPVSGAISNMLFSQLALVTDVVHNLNPNLNFFFSTATQTDSALTGGNIKTTYNTFVQEQFEVIYDYTLTSGVPEPATMALMGGALIGLGLLGKRLKKN